MEFIKKVQESDNKIIKETIVKNEVNTNISLNLNLSKSCHYNLFKNFNALLIKIIFQKQVQTIKIMIKKIIHIETELKVNSLIIMFQKE